MIQIVLKHVCKPTSDSDSYFSDMFRVVVLLCVVVTSLAKTCDDAPYNNRCTCDFNPYTNGCSSPTGKYTPYQRQFTQACNKHDVCYKCVSIYKKEDWSIWCTVRVYNWESLQDYGSTRPDLFPEAERDGKRCGYSRGRRFPEMVTTWPV